MTRERRPPGPGHRAGPEGRDRVAMLAIDTLEAIQARGTTQWIRVRGADVSNPVLLLIQQGPGLPMINEARLFEPVLGLEQAFTVVYWDQRGCGRSLRGRQDRAGISVERMAVTRCRSWSSSGTVSAGRHMSPGSLSARRSERTPPRSAPDASQILPIAVAPGRPMSRRGRHDHAEFSCPSTELGWAPHSRRQLPRGQH